MLTAALNEVPVDSVDKSVGDFMGLEDLGIWRRVRMRYTSWSCCWEALCVSGTLGRASGFGG